MQLAVMLGTTYKTAWSMLRRIRTAMGQRDETHQLCGAIEFDDAYFGGPTTGKKRSRGTEKEKVFVALSLDERGNPGFLKMRVTPNIKQASVKKFAHAAFADGSEIRSEAIVIIFRPWRATPMNINPTIPIPAFFIGCTS